MILGDGVRLQVPPGLPPQTDNDPYRQGFPLEVGVFVEPLPLGRTLLPRVFCLVKVPFGRERLLV